MYVVDRDSSTKAKFALINSCCHSSLAAVKTNYDVNPLKSLLANLPESLLTKKLIEYELREAKKQ